jgi:hypothetical protein
MRQGRFCWRTANDPGDRNGRDARRVDRRGLAQRPSRACLAERDRGLIAAPAETVVATEEWPICTIKTAMGTDVDWAQLDPDFAAGKRALVAGNWTGAIAALEFAVLRDPCNAHRRLRQWGPAMGHYQQVLMFNPRHRGAREHLGELYLALGEPDKGARAARRAEEKKLMAKALLDCSLSVGEGPRGTRRLSLGAGVATLVALRGCPMC